MGSRQTSNVARTLVLANGRRLSIRPLQADDVERVAALYARLGPESRRRRFLSPKPELAPRELAYLVDVDHARREAFAAVDGRDGSIVGVGRYAQDSGRPAVADVAVEVADDVQGMGIGTALMRRVIQSAAARGFAAVTATTLWENQPARALLRSLGFRACRSRGPEIELALTLTSEGPAR